jgi:hypothetical protein
VFAFDCPNTYKAATAYSWQGSQSIGGGPSYADASQTMLDEAMRGHQIGHRKGAMNEMAQAMTLITQSRP